MSDIVYEGAWDCSNCGMTRIPASSKQCPRCKDPQNSVLSPAEDWYLPDDAPVVTDPAELAKAGLPAWNCGHCGTLNDGDATKCSCCDRPLDFDDTVNRRVTFDDRAGHFDAKPDPRDEMVESDLDRTQRTIDTKASGPRVMGDLTLRASESPTVGQDTQFYEAIRDKAKASFDQRMRIKKLPPIVQRLYPHRKSIAIAAAALLAVVLVVTIVGVVRHYTATVSGTVTVSELHWERKVEVEQYAILTDSDWSYPGDARILSTQNRIRSYRTVHDGWRSESYTDYETHYRSESYSYDCSYTVSNGNGKFTRVSRTCSGTRQVPYQVAVPKVRQVEVTHQEPVFGTWYTYQVDRWTTERWVTASDATSNTVIWPVPTSLAQNTQPGDQVGEERVGDERNASYAVVYNDARGIKHSEQRTDDNLWNKLKLGEIIPAHYYERDGSLASVDWQAA